MNIMLDTNVLLKWILFKNYEITQILSLISQKNKIIVDSYAIKELSELIFRKKFNKCINIYHSKDGHENLKQLNNIYNSRSKIIEKILFDNIFIITDSNPIKTNIKCRDKKDIPILTAAIKNNIDYLITFDNDLLELNNEYGFKIISINELKNSMLCL